MANSSNIQFLALYVSWHNILIKYFHKLFSSGTFPSEWAESVILTSIVISLLNASGKLYGCILNKRLTQWIEDNKLQNEAQAGFRRNYSTIDDVFTLLALVHKQLLSHGKLYVCFIDFKKAFDLIDRNNLRLILKKNGTKGKMYMAVRRMYEVVKARVRVDGDLTEAFMCSRGLKQGDSCSPVLFSLFTNELGNEIVLKGKHGITLSPDLLQILIVLFCGCYNSPF